MRKLLVFIALVFTIFSLISQELDILTLSKKEIIKLIDISILEQNEDVFKYLGSLGIDFKDYKYYEKYILEEALNLAGSGDLEYPLKLVEAVLYNNLENEKAQELYSLIINKKIELTKRLEAEKLKSEQKREEIALIAAETEKAFIKEERLSDIVTSNQELLSTINGYIDNFDKTHYVSNSYFYPIHSRFYSSEVYDGFYNTESEINSYNGFSTDMGIGIALKKFIFRMETSGSISYNDLLNDNIKQITGSINISMGFLIYNLPLYIRLGFLYDTYLYDDMDNTEVAITTLPSPSVGIGITGLRLFKVLKLDLSSDYLIAATYTNNLDYAFYNRAYLTLNLIRFGIYNLEIRGGLDNLYYKEGGLSEYSLLPKFGFGISSYE